VRLDSTEPTPFSDPLLCAPDVPTDNDGLPIGPEDVS
jgi:hypothetical protein